LIASDATPRPRGRSSATDVDSVETAVRRRIAICSVSYYHALVETISVKLPPAVRRKLAAEASRRNVAQSVIVRESIERALANSMNSKEPASCAEVARDLIGAIRSGRRDSATNKALLEKAMMQSDRRGSKRRR
jgi:predicted DNA-binding protein